jgi:hypothetical protein
VQAEGGGSEVVGDEYPPVLPGNEDLVPHVEASVGGEETEASVSARTRSAGSSPPSAARSRARLTRPRQKRPPEISQRDPFAPDARAASE